MTKIIKKIQPLSIAFTSLFFKSHRNFRSFYTEKGSYLCWQSWVLPVQIEITQRNSRTTIYYSEIREKV